MLTQADLDGMIATVTSTLPSTCTLRTLGLTADGAGGWTETPTDVTVACRVSPLATAGRDFEAVEGSKEISSVPWVLTFPAGTVVGPSDRVFHNDQRFEVVAESSDRTWELDVRMICRLVS